MTARLLAAAVLAAAALAAAPAALARDAAPAEVRLLARQAAAGDAAALAELRRIDSVGGVPVQLGRALDAPAAERRARLRALARAGAPAAAEPVEARERAAAILRDPRFGTREPAQRTRVNGGWLDRVSHRIGRLLHRLLPHRSGGVGGGGGPGWLSGLLELAAVAVVVALVVLGIRALLRRPRRPASVRGDAAEVAAPAGVPALLRAAEEAEASGDLEAALRLRFRAGLRVLQERRVVPWRDSVTTREVSRRVRLRDFDLLARRFDEVVYGRRPAALDDIDAARTGWERVLETAGRR